jgi:hypothetical protein
MPINKRITFDPYPSSTAKAPMLTAARKKEASLLKPLSLTKNKLT